MERNLPIAVINGGESFLAKNLWESLKSRGMRVEVIGETVENLGEIEEQIRYVFDFNEDGEVWKEVIEKGSKLCVVDIKGEKEAERMWTKLRGISGDWRLVEGINVYGEGMEKVGFLGEVMAEAAGNKNLKLPKLGEKFRLVFASDMVEAIMRASILSGTVGGLFLVAGNETDSKELAEVLVDEAKMTRLSVIQEEIGVEEIDKERVEETRKILGWKPVVTLREGVRETVRDFVMRADEEGRKRKSLNSKVKNLKYKDTETKRERFQEVVVEEENQISDIRYQKDKDEVEEEVEIKPLIKKKEIEINYENQENNIPIKNDFNIEKKRLGWMRKIKWVGVIAILVGVIGGILSWPVVGVLGVVLSLEKPFKLVEENRISEALKLVVANTDKNKKAGDFLEGSGLGRWPMLNRVGELSGIAGGVLEIEGKLITLATTTEKINRAVFEEGEIDWTGELLKLTDNMEETEIKAGILVGRLSEMKRWIPGRWKPEVDRAIRTISEKLEIAGKFRDLSETIPEILGLDGKRREYMVLLQNEMEIRATGGFVGSYAILSFEGGRLLSFEVKDVYEADGQLKGHVEPPEEIKKYLGESGWFMRDANWQASFPQTSREIQWFLEKETGRKVDGVIGMDLAVAKMILGVTGEIYVPDFKEKVNKDNLYEQAEFWSETNSFPGSTQKASFLGGLGTQLFEEIKNLKTTKRWELMMGMVEMLERNEIQLGFNHSETAEAMAEAGWDGSVYEGECSGPRCYADYLYVVESNLGINKANYFLYRNMEERVDISAGWIKRDLKINYENTAKSSNWPGGDYKNYLRVYLPKEAEVTEIGMGEDGVIRTIPMVSVKMREIYGKKEVGFLVTVPIRKKVTVEIKYQSNGVGQGDKFSYLQYIQRQSGFGDTALLTLISIPDGWQPVQVTPVASMKEGKLLFNQKLDRDIKMGVEITK
ncbi:hypothetical protein COS78_01680 [Candidatus Shapirobacteria bacterium CG06_land_8_20_14_3_00_40_12]|uniref:DUF4012 domain-containing protein n=2 Tax=Candidatus Shapironibacteriota TaxID=1752721 RepID=A0A2M7TRZ9_9BACT|nr:MAG: hypothetical protein COS78_01680 [Candidatus Shapirobacteria bacterium CG06_land_8_20_14_3_00_40_12]PIZ58332.1 MAG: hypothetical protein COY20_03750 [Candidatus Shapirobacteria bacterium CG_4_10_14_0_2_um_filter_40_12]